MTPEPLAPSLAGDPCLPLLAPPSFVIYDLETTGLYPHACEIIQIAATRFREGQVVPDDTFFYQPP